MMDALQAFRIDNKELQEKNQRLEKALKLVLGYFRDEDLVEKAKLQDHVSSQLNLHDKQDADVYFSILDRLY